MKSKHGILIQEVYNNYTPPFSIQRTVDNILTYVPEKHLLGLSSIILTNKDALSRKKRKTKSWHRKHKIALENTNGSYYQKWKKEPARIELIVDNILNDMPSFLRCIPYYRNMTVAGVLHHELGHHIHRTQLPENKEKEDVANKWRDRLNARYGRRKYWYLLPIFFCLFILLKPFVKHYLKTKN